jgi:hypothetical protein
MAMRAIYAVSKQTNETLKCAGMSIPWHSKWVPEPTVLFPMIALVVSSLVNIKVVKSGVPGVVENLCEFTVQSLRCNCEEACESCCDCENYISCKDVSCFEPTLLWQVLAALVALAGIGYAITKTVLMPRAYLPLDLAEDEDGSKIVADLKTVGVTFSGVDWPLHFVFPAVALGFSVWTLASNSSEVLGPTALALNIITILVSVAGILFGIFAFRKYLLLRFKMSRKTAEGLGQLVQDKDLLKYASNVASRHPNLFKDCSKSIPQDAAKAFTSLSQQAETTMQLQQANLASAKNSVRQIRDNASAALQTAKLRAQKLKQETLK